MKITKTALPRIGQRIIKSAAAVFLCFVVDWLRNGEGIVFYSQLAALWCMQDYINETKKKAYQRTIGTVVGALYGLAVLVLYTHINMTEVSEKLFESITVSLMIIAVIYTTVLINKRQASYFSCVVFLSIVINHITDANPYLFVWNRFLDTMIGIFIGVAVNTFHLPHAFNKDTFFISGLDDTLLDKNDNLSAYSRVELNRMLDSGLLFTISTMRTPASLMEPLKDIRLRLPVIVMDGAALYDIKEKMYVRSYVISSDTANQVTEFLRRQGAVWFTNVIIDDMLVIYYQETDDEQYNALIKTLRRSPYRNYVKREPPKDEAVVYFMLIDKKERIETLHAALEKQSFFGKLKVLKYDSEDYAGYSYIKIYNHNATKQNMTDYLAQRLSVENIVTFGSIEGRYTYTIDRGDSNQVVRLIKKEFEPIKKPKRNIFM